MPAFLTSFPVATNSRAKAWTCIFFTALLIIGLCTSGDYGRPWDEADEMDILRMNLWEYAQRLQLPQAPFFSLADAAALDRSASGQLRRPLTPISQSIERDHGQCAYYPLATMAMDTALPEATLMLFWHLYTWFLFWLGAVGLYGCCRHLSLSRGSACLAALMLMLSPRMFAEGHYNNKDIVLMSLTLLMLWQALALMRSPTGPRALLFALFGAMAANTKVVGLALWGLCGLFILFHLHLQKSLNKCTLRIALLSFIAFGTFYALLTPALWADPVGFLTYIVKNALGFTRWENLILFKGIVYDTAHQSLPRLYLPYMILVTTPLWILLLLLLGQAVALMHITTKKFLELRMPLLLCSLLWLLPLAFAVCTRTLVYNGWRHFFFLYGPMLVMAAYGLSWFQTHALKKSARHQVLLRRISIIILSLCMLSTGAEIAFNHPYQYAFYNFLVARTNLNTYLERDYWNVSVMNALQTLLAQLDAPTPEGTTIAGGDLWAQVGVEHAIPLLPANAGLRTVNAEEESPDFWLINHTYQQLSGWKPPNDSVAEVQIIAYGQPLVSLYKNLP